MNILLVNPPRSPQNGILAHADDAARAFIHKKLIGPPLGLLTIAAAARDHDVTVLEMKGEYDLVPDSPAPADLLREYLRRTDPRVVGMTFIASEFPVGLELFRAVKACNPEILTVAGGLHATLCPGDFADPAIDVVCVGPGGQKFRDIIRAIEKDQPLDHIEGIGLNSESGLEFTPTNAAPYDPAGKDFIPPDRTHLKRWLSTYIVGQAEKPCTYLFTSLGCPYQCSFCSVWPQYEGRYLQRDVESVIQELKTLDDYEVVRFADANTLVNIDFAEELFDRIEAEGIRKQFVMDIRADTAAKYPKLIEKLARGGLKVVICGFESYRQDELQKYNKNLQSDLIEKSIEVFHDNGIMLRGNYVIPADYSLEDFQALEQFAGANPVNFAGYTILTPLPGTQFYREVKDDIIDRDLSKYNLFNCVMKPKLPMEEFYQRVASLWLIRKGTETI